ncbi:MAG: amidohydrolase [Gammaproteobacteria bacterium]|nr:amidohydrolase [Gammaproteobacteria bacterium]
MSVLRVSLVQQPLQWHDAAANREHFTRLLAPLAGGTDLVVLPETFTTGFSMKVSTLAENESGPTLAWLKGQAARLDAAIAGSVITVSAGRYFNRLLWAEPDGTVRHYDKRHLFRMALEHEHFTAGREPLLLTWRGVRVCPLVCYDLRFPVFSRRRPALDYELLLYVANWPAARAAAWEALLRARSIENQAYVVGVNRTGVDGLNIPYRGGSAALDFLGRPLLQLGEAPLVATVGCDAGSLAAFRDRFPAHLDADGFTLAEDR